MTYHTIRGIKLQKLVSGGQTGVDRAALDAALELEFPCGGWCPRGRRAVDGVIPAKYPLSEHSSPEYRQRTEQNVIDSDATLILNQGPLQGGTALTVAMANKYHKPCLILQLEEKIQIDKLCAWLQAQDVRILNVAGPREEKHPGIQQQAFFLLHKLLSSLS